MKIEPYLKERAALVEDALAGFVAGSAETVEPRLLEGIRYALLSGGKRIRPILLLAAGEAVGAALEPLLPLACAVEMVHTYSLVHDDLPAMDDDDFRRGRPSTHRVFGEGIAILVGDALLTDAFGLLARSASGEAARAAVVELAAAAGAAGMVGGQTADLLAEGAAADWARVESIHRRKTGALLRAALRIGALAGGAEPDALDCLTRYGEAVGLAFQVADDLLDEIGDIASTGKAAPRDRERGKLTVPAALGVGRARTLLRDLLGAAGGALAGFDERAEPLRAIARYVVGRAL